MEFVEIIINHIYESQMIEYIVVYKLVQIKYFYIVYDDDNDGDSFYI